jgi:hypothetical protein
MQAGLCGSCWANLPAPLHRKVGAASGVRARLWFFIWRGLTGFFRGRVVPNGPGGVQRCIGQGTCHHGPKDAGEITVPVIAKNAERKDDRSGNPDGHGANRLRLVIVHNVLS